MKPELGSKEGKSSIGSSWTRYGMQVDGNPDDAPFYKGTREGEVDSQCRCRLRQSGDGIFFNVRNGRWPRGLSGSAAR